jgi:hypothetical protein
LLRTLFNHSHPGLSRLQVLWDDSVDSDNTILSGGNGTDVTKLPLNGTAGCKPVYPSQWARVNNIFQADT